MLLRNGLRRAVMFWLRRFWRVGLGLAWDRLGHGDRAVHPLFVTRPVEISLRDVLDHTVRDEVPDGPILAGSKPTLGRGDGQGRDLDEGQCVLREILEMVGQMFDPEFEAGPRYSDEFSQFCQVRILSSASAPVMKYSSAAGCCARRSRRVSTV